MIEQHVGRGGSSDSSKSERVRRFLVTGQPDTVLFDPELPQLGSVYPGGNPNVPFPLTLDRYDVSPVGDNVHSWVDCIYTNARSGRLDPSADRTKPGFATWEFTFQQHQVDFPSLLKYPLLVPGADIPAANTPALDAKIHKVTETMTVATYSAVLQGVSRAQIDLIRAQDNNIHKMPDGRIWLFSAGDLRQTEKSAWEVTYTWGLDVGTPEPPSYINPNDPNRPGTIYQWIVDLDGDASGIPANQRRFLYSPTPREDMWQYIDASIAIQAGLLVRSPFHVIKYEVPSSMVPRFFQHCPYRYSPDGWQGLPGFNP